MRYEVDIPWFNGRCDELNTYLIRYFKDDQMENVVFWKRSVFGQQKVNKLLTVKIESILILSQDI